MKKISVIMPSFLGDYPNCATERPYKFIRAVDSFLAQTYKDKELVVIADGCPDTKAIVLSKYRKEVANGLIVLVEYERQSRKENFVGYVRQKGIEKATGQIICNLDTDDYFLPNHLNNLAVSFGSADWVFWNPITKPDNIKDVEFYSDMKAELGSINNGSIAWRAGLDVSWAKCDGTHDNQSFIAQLLAFMNHKKIYGCGYVIAHSHLQIKKV